MSAPQMFAVVVTTLLLAAILNGAALVRGAETMPYGERRDFWLGVWRPFQDAGHALYLDQPRAWLDDATGREGAPPAPVEFPVAAAQPEPSEPAGPPLALAATPSATPSPPSPTPEPTVRPPTPAEPLRLWVGGDSLAGIFGQSLVRMSSETGLVEAVLDYRISTGLSRPDYFNWPAELQRVSEQTNPDVMVLVFGSNDPQGLRTPDGAVVQPMSDGWRGEYRRRVAGTMDLLRRPDRLLVWVGLPPMRDGHLSEQLGAINAIYREEADARPGVVFVDTSVILGDGGKYAAYLPDRGGHVELVREPDGVHLTRAGGDRLADEVMRVISDAVRLHPQAIAAP
jgi:hypothetical protein